MKGLSIELGDAGWGRDGRESDGGERIVGGERFWYGRGIADAGWGRDGRERYGGERGVGR